MIKYFYSLILLIFGFSVISSCNDPATGPNNHLPPETYLSVFSMPGDTLAPGKTVKKISWWGDSPNGYVIGFRISFDSVNWGYTTQNDSTFTFTLAGQDSTFKMWVAAVDDKQIVDPTPASNKYPVVNSPPSIAFDQSLTLPDTIFPIATVKWIGTDPDGDNTIKRYWYSINDTLNFKPLSGSINIMTLTRDSGLVTGNNCIYMKAEDNAHAFSSIVRMPQADSLHFYVKNVTSKILVIKDVPTTVSPNELDTLNNFLLNTMDMINYETLDIKANGGNLIPKNINPMFIETLKLFNIVMWFSNRNGGSNTSDDPNLNLAQNSLPFYLNAGGKVFWSSGTPNVTLSQGSLFNFAPMDSVKTTCFIQFYVTGDTIFSHSSLYPNLYVSYNIAHTNSLYLNSSLVQSIYQIPPYSSRPYCTDMMYIGFKSPTYNPNLFFMFMPVYFLNGRPENSKAFIRQVLINEFGYSK